MEQKLKQIIDKIIKISNPVSIFLYGSRAKGDYTDESDYEIGIVYKSIEDKPDLQTIQKCLDDSTVSAYPFILKDLYECTIDTPFQKKIFIYELKKIAKTIFGEDILGQIDLPIITKTDIVEDVRFYVGLSLASIISDRNGDQVTARDLFYKSCLFGLRDLIYLQKGLLPTNYKSIYIEGQDLSIPENYKILTRKAIDVRENKCDYDRSDLYQNISFLNNYIEQKIKD